MDTLVESDIFAMECFELSIMSIGTAYHNATTAGAPYLLEVWEQAFEVPSFSSPAIVVARLTSRIHHEVNGRSTTERSASSYNGLASSKVLALFRVVEDGILRIRNKMRGVNGRGRDCWIVQVTLPCISELEKQLCSEDASVPFRLQ